MYVQVGWTIVHSTVILTGAALAIGGTEGHRRSTTAKNKPDEDAAAGEALTTTTDGSPQGSCATINVPSLYSTYRLSFASV